MEPAEFDAHFGSLNQAADRARSAIYVIVGLYLVMFVYSLTVFAYPSSQFEFDRLLLDARCVLDPHPADPAQEPCKSNADRAALLADRDNPPQLDFARDMWIHRVERAYDDSAANRDFQVPAFGLKTDRDLSWIIFPVIGMVGYFIVWLSISRTADVFRFLYQRNLDNAGKLRLLQSSLLVTTPLSTEAIGFTPWMRTLWSVLFGSIFVVPIIASVLVIFDLTNLIEWFRDGQFIWMPAGTCWTWIKFAVTTALMLLEGLLFHRLVVLARAFGCDQTTVARRIKELEGKELQGAP